MKSKTFQFRHIRLLIALGYILKTSSWDHIDKMEIEVEILEQRRTGRTLEDSKPGAYKVSFSNLRNFQRSSVQWFYLILSLFSLFSEASATKPGVPSTSQVQGY